MKLQRLIWMSALASDLGLGPVCLLLRIADAEDRFRYSKAPTFWDSQLQEQLGVDQKTLASYRTKCVKAGWLHYEPGCRNREGRYFVTVPEWAAAQLDGNEQGQFDGNSPLNTRQQSSDSQENLRSNPDKLETKQESIGNQNRTKPGRSIPDPDPETTTTDDWSVVAEALKELKISRRTDVISIAKASGFKPEQVVRLIKYLKSEPRCTSPGGSIVSRLKNSDAADWEFDEGWQWSNSAEPSSPYEVPSDVQQEDAKRLEAESLERKRKHIANVERRELMFGEQLNAMSFADHMALIGTAPPANRELLTRDYQAKGRDSPDVRPELLRLLEAVEQKNGLAVAS